MYSRFVFQADRTVGEFLPKKMILSPSGKYVAMIDFVPFEQFIRSTLLIFNTETNTTELEVSDSLIYSLTFNP